MNILLRTERSIIAYMRNHDSGGMLSLYTFIFFLISLLSIGLVDTDLILPSSRVHGHLYYWGIGFSPILILLTFPLYKSIVLKLSVASKFIRLAFYLIPVVCTIFVLGFEFSTKHMSPQEIQSQIYKNQQIGSPPITLKAHFKSCNKAFFLTTDVKKRCANYSKYYYEEMADLKWDIGSWSFSRAFYIAHIAIQTLIISIAICCYLFIFAMKETNKIFYKYALFGYLTLMPYMYLRLYQFKVKNVLFGIVDNKGTNIILATILAIVCIVLVLRAKKETVEKWKGYIWPGVTAIGAALAIYSGWFFMEFIESGEVSALMFALSIPVCSAMILFLVLLPDFLTDDP